MSVGKRGRPGEELAQKLGARRRIIQDDDEPTMNTTRTTPDQLTQATSDVMADDDDFDLNLPEDQNDPNTIPAVIPTFVPIKQEPTGQQAQPTGGEDLDALLNEAAARYERTRKEENTFTLADLPPSIDEDVIKQARRHNRAVLGKIKKRSLSSVRDKFKIGELSKVLFLKESAVFNMANLPSLKAILRSYGYTLDADFEAVVRSNLIPLSIVMRGVDMADRAGRKNLTAADIQLILSTIKDDKRIRTAAFDIASAAQKDEKYTYRPLVHNTKLKTPAWYPTITNVGNERVTTETEANKQLSEQYRSLGLYRIKRRPKGKIVDANLYIPRPKAERAITVRNDILF